MVQEMPAEPSKKLHPFFTAQRQVSPSPNASVTTTGESYDASRTNPVLFMVDGSGDRPHKRQRTESDVDDSRNSESIPGSSISPGDFFPASTPTKKAADLDSTNYGPLAQRSNGGEAVQDVPSQALTATTSSALNSGQPPLEPTSEVASEKVEAAPAKLKKLLRLNPKTGTIGSPPKPKTQITSSEGQPVAKETNAKSRSYIVKLRYGTDPAHRAHVGEQIDEILKGSSQLGDKGMKSSGGSKTAPRTGTAPKSSKPAKSTHPFFTGKSGSTQEVKDVKASTESSKQVQTARKTIFTSTPCSPKKPRAQVTGGRILQFGVRSTGLKIPGAAYPAWPAKGMSHIRGPMPDQLMLPSGSFGMVLRERRSKGQIVTVGKQESAIRRLQESLIRTRSDSLYESRSELRESELPPAQLRLPKRHFESGKALRERIRPQLRTLGTYHNRDARALSEDELAISNPAVKPHPAVERLYNMLSTQLSAFDKSDCESSIWFQKYAPLRAHEILQDGREAILLRQWLRTLKVQSVDTGASAPLKRSLPVKKKRKTSKLDGFIVSSEDEASEMDELSESENWTPTLSSERGRKTVIRSGDVRAKGSKEPARLTNAVLISGPHGCGKSATVYAIAQELDFEVFEISSSSRRSGRDILEKVGDMTRNHLVQQHRTERRPPDDEASADDEVLRDLKSGKQSTMASFFQPKESKSRPTAKSAAQPRVNDSKKPPTPKAQKQSLILLEEVDVLYQEDKQFWATIMELMVQSKRPFVMTCNDETLVPLQSLTLHGIFRFSPPPKDAAIDVLLLTAANEGHALQRESVTALYEARFGDLRCCLTELNFWCQFGVGDRRGGFDWFYLRWPKGCDLDQQGSVVRVVSEDAYSKAMGWTCRDTLFDTGPQGGDDLWLQAWDGWKLDLESWDRRHHLAQGFQSPASSRGENLKALACYDDYCDAVSIADICSSGAFGLGLQERLDTTVPLLRSNVRDDFTVGRQLIEASTVNEYVNTTVLLPMCLMSLARRCGEESNRATSLYASPPTERTLEAQVIRDIEASLVTTPTICRRDFSGAFDPIALSEKALGTTLGYLEPSVFDRPMRLLATDVAPHVRGIVAYDQRLMEERLRRSNLLSEGGRPGKRMRNTRSAFSALEGGARGLTRRENYFAASLNSHAVLGTGGNWEQAVGEQLALDEEQLKKAGVAGAIGLTGEQTDIELS